MERLELTVCSCIGANVKVLCVCGVLVALTVGIALKLNRITSVYFSTSTAITQNTCYAFVPYL